MIRQDSCKFKLHDNISRFFFFFYCEYYFFLVLYMFVNLQIIGGSDVCRGGNGGLMVNNVVAIAGYAFLGNELMCWCCMVDNWCWLNCLITHSGNCVLDNWCAGVHHRVTMRFNGLLTNQAGNERRCIKCIWFGNCHGNERSKNDLKIINWLI